MLEEYVGKVVILHVDKDLSITGILSNHKPNLYQVTGKDNHFVFYDYEIVGIVNNELIHKYCL